MFRLTAIGLCFAGPAFAGDFERTFPADKVRHVTIAVADADVTAIGWTETKVKVVADGDPGVEVTDDAIAIGRFDPKKRPKDHHKWTHWHSDLSSVKVYLPAAADLEVRSLSGALEVEKIAGRMKLLVISGDVRLSDCSGAADLEAVSGDVTIRGLSADLNARAVSGEVTVIGFDALNLEVKSVSGEIAIRDAKTRTTRIATHSGDLFFQGDAPADGSIEMTTFSGDVEVRLPDKRGFELDASTFSGEVSVKRSLTLREGSQNRVRGRTKTVGPRLRLKSHSGDVQVK
jgi:hypothetical protein